MKHPRSCQCGGTEEVERGPAGATYSYPCYSWDCKVPLCLCKLGSPAMLKDLEDARARLDKLEAMHTQAAGCGG
jgi:hypothetical protein